MIQIPGYNISDKIFESRRSIVFRGQKKKNRQDVIIKVLRGEYPSLEDLAQFRREFEITQSLGLDGIIKVYSLEKVKNSLAIVMEDIGAISVDHLLAELKSDIKRILDIAVRICDILIGMRKKKIIHKNINPSNIIWNRKSDQIKLIDFGISSKLSKEVQEISNPELLEGTLAYMSPEQTGRMNRAIDYRTDLYSLGITLYEWLSGVRPFISTDPMETVHSHLAIQPKPPHKINRNIPRILSQVIMKLLAKTAEERYQGAFGLKADLERCLKEYQSKGKITDFILAEKDFSRIFQIPQKLYGRDKEIKELLVSFDKISKGSVELLLVAGYSGVGKSALVHEVHKPIVEKRGYFISGKFEKLKQDVPYASLIQAFNSMIKQILTENKERIAYWKIKILEALGNNCQVIIDIIPEVELLTGKQPDMPQLPPVETQHRFIWTFENFIRTFAGKSHPLVIFLDDLQWADLSSLNLLKQLLSDPEQKYILFIGAYRDNEVDSSHPLMLTINELNKTGAKVSFINLAPLKKQYVNQLVSDSLLSTPKNTEELARLCSEKTEGNPFFLCQFLYTINDSGEIYFDSDNGSWAWDVKKIKEKDITSNVVELMAGKMHNLPEANQKVLQSASCIGSRFDLKTLAELLGKSLKEIATLLWPALDQGFILPLGASYKFIKDGDVWYKFLHDRIFEATYGLLPEREKINLHYKIGKNLLSKTEEGNGDEFVFQIVHHLNISAEKIDSRDEKNELCRLNYRAGRKAKNSTAYEAALSYFRRGIDLLDDPSPQTGHEIALGLFSNRAQCEYLLNNYEEAEKWFDLSLKKTLTNLEKAQILYNLLIMHSLKNNFHRSIDYGYQALEVLGMNLPKESGEIQKNVGQEIGKVETLLKGKKVSALIDLPEMKDLEKIEIIKICMQLLPQAYMIGNINLYTLLSLLMVNISLENSNSKFSSHAYAMYGVILANSFENFDLAYSFGELSIELGKRYNDSLVEGRNNFVFAAFIFNWKKRLKDSMDLLFLSFKKAIESGDVAFAGYSAVNCQFNYLLAGENIDIVQRKMETFQVFIKKTGDGVVKKLFLIWNNFILALKGETNSRLSLTNERQSEEDALDFYGKTNNLAALADYFLIKSTLLIVYGDFQKVNNFWKKIKPLLIAVSGQVKPNHFIYHSLSRAVLLDSLETEERNEIIKDIHKELELIKNWAKNAPENYEAWYLLIQAELIRAENKTEEIITLYDKAIQSAHKNEILYLEGIGNERAANFHLSKGNKFIASAYLSEARYRFEKWGATAKVKDMEGKYSNSLARPGISSPDHFYSSITNTSGTPAQALDISTVIKASQSISSEIELRKMLSSMISIIIENAGAERGILLLKKGSEFFVEAESSAKQKGANVLQSLFLDRANLAASVVQYVIRTQNAVVLDRAFSDEQFMADEYIRRSKTKSLLCSPIIHQGKLIGILYLENNLAGGAFTPDRLKILKMLSAQTAISIDNALLYANLEDKVYERTKEVEEQKEELSRMNDTLLDSNKDLKKAQESLKNLNQGLEAKVTERTRELMNSNMLLKEEISERKRLEKKNLEAKDKIIKEMKAHEDYVFEVAHRLRNPLQIFKSSLELFDSSNLTDEQKKFLDTIKKRSLDLENGIKKLT